MIPNYIIEKVTLIAKKSNVKRSKLGAILFTPNGRIISFTNNRKIYGVDGIFTVHAEAHLIAKSHKLRAERFGQLCMLVVRYMSGSRQLSLAKPCDRCTYLLRETNWKVYYSNENGDIQELN